MPKSDFIEPNDDAFAAQLALCKAALPAYAAALDLSPARISAQAADADAFAWVIAAQGAMQQAALQWTGWKNLSRQGGALPPSGAPVAPVLPAAPPAVDPGIEPRFRALARQIKAHAAYNEALGKALGIEGPERAAPDLASLKPAIAVQASGGRVEVSWGWQGHGAFLDLCELQVDRADGKGWALLAYDTTPGYADTAPLPTAPAKWTYRAIYRAIYRVGDAQVGQWSDPASLTVGG